MNIVKAIHKNPKLTTLFFNSFGKSKIKTSHVIGDSFIDPIDVSTAQVLLQATEKHSQKVALHCYDQQKDLTYE